MNPAYATTPPPVNPQQKPDFGLYRDLQDFQLWSKGAMLTAQLSRASAERGFREERYYVISGQAVGFTSELNRR